MRVPRRCGDLAEVLAVINDAAEAYRGVIPADRWHEPYMAADALARDVAAGVAFWGLHEDGLLTAVAGVQPVDDVTLIRHAYVRTAWRRRGLGETLLRARLADVAGPVLIGTWEAATWAIAFYEKLGFRRLAPDDGRAQLRRYWSIPERQTATSVVLAGGGGRVPDTPVQK